MPAWCSQICSELRFRDSNERMVSEMSVSFRFGRGGAVRDHAEGLNLTDPGTHIELGDWGSRRLWFSSKCTNPPLGADFWGR
jgi:hypothetical protein